MNMQDTAGKAVLEWLAAIGAGCAADLAAVAGLSARAAGTRLRAMEQAGIARSARLLHGEPALYTLTRRGLRAAGREELEPVTLSASGFAHALAVARVAVALGARGHRVGGERELRCWEALEGGAIASAQVGFAADGTIALHRPDLVCWGAGPPVAIEVELSVKAPARLRAIVRGWARSRVVGGVVYYASPNAMRALSAAVSHESASERVVVLAIDRAGELPAAMRGEALGPRGPVE